MAGKNNENKNKFKKIYGLQLVTLASDWHLPHNDFHTQ